MTYNIEQAIEKLSRRLIKMASLVEEEAKLAFDLLNFKNPEKIEQIFVKEAKVDKYEVKVKKLAQKILVLLRPVTSDLRFVMASLSIGLELEKISDLSRNIAYLIKDGEYDFSVSDKADLREITILCKEILKLAIDSLVVRNLEYAKRVFALEKKINQKYRSSLKELKKIAQERPECSVKILANYQILENIERIADCSVKIAKEVFFIMQNLILKKKDIENLLNEQSNSHLNF